MNFINAFLIGGFICFIGQILMDKFKAINHASIFGMIGNIFLLIIKGIINHKPLTVIKVEVSNQRSNCKRGRGKCKG